MSSLARRIGRTPAKKREVRAYVQRQFDAWARRQVQHEPRRLLVLGVGAAALATVLATLLLLVLLVPRIQRLEERAGVAPRAVLPPPAPLHRVPR
jgi:hypothetical protein